TNFSNWSSYVADLPAVLLVRVSPKLVEGFLTGVARGAARTQGVSVPPLKRPRTSFLQMRADCGDPQIGSIHPFRLEQHISDTDIVYEGLYVYDPAALGPDCGTVKLMLSSEKEPTKTDTRIIDAAGLQRISRDFATTQNP